MDPKTKRAAPRRLRPVAALPCRLAAAVDVTDLSESAERSWMKTSVIVYAASKIAKSTVNLGAESTGVRPFSLRAEPRPQLHPGA
jgi:hypothetical protein